MLCLGGDVKVKGRGTFILGLAPLKRLSGSSRAFGGGNCSDGFCALRQSFTERKCEDGGD